MKELQNLMSIGDVAKSFGVCVAHRKAVVQKRQILASHQNNRKSKAF